MRRLFLFLLLGLFVFLGVQLTQRSRWVDASLGVCELVFEHFYRYDLTLKAWNDKCVTTVRSLPLLVSRGEAISELQALMDELRVSHMQMYTPQEDKKVWTGQGLDSGVRARWVEDHLVVFKVLPGSGAELAGVLVGDDILSIDGNLQVSPYMAANNGGMFEVRRRGEVKGLNIVATDLKGDGSPQVRRLSSDVALLEITSFRSEYFEAEAWRQVVSELRGYKQIFVDIRDNPGGNFVAMLRALSSFLCERKVVGTLVQPRKDKERLNEFTDETSDDFQIQQLDKYSSITLRTYDSYGCLRQPVSVLTNADSSSVSEIFAQAMKGRSRTEIRGHPTAGNVVLAVWYDLPLFGRGHSISIPEAVYLTPSGEELEGSGVWPTREMHYDLKSALEGRDSWLE